MAIAPTFVRRSRVAQAAALGLPEVVAFTVPSNVASRRVIEKADLRPAGAIDRAGLPHVLFELSLAAEAGGGREDRAPPGERRLSA